VIFKDIWRKFRCDTGTKKWGFIERFANDRIKIPVPAQSIHFFVCSDFNEEYFFLTRIKKCKNKPLVICDTE